MRKRQRNRKETGLCPFCLETKPLTTEHIPPRNLFLKPRPDNTITVYACGKCNGSTKQDDEYFRVLIAGSDSEHPDVRRLWKEKVVGSSFERSSAFRQMLIDDREALMQHVQKEPLRTMDGQLIDKELYPRALPLKTDRIRRVVEKIVRGLYCHHENTPLPVETRFEIDLWPLDQSTAIEILSNRTGLVGGNNCEFVYRYRANGSGEYDTKWELMFYLSTLIRVQTRAN